MDRKNLLGTRISSVESKDFAEDGRHDNTLVNYYQAMCMDWHSQIQEDTHHNHRCLQLLHLFQGQNIRGDKRHY